jgi:hypothetical protein
MRKSGLLFLSLTLISSGCGIEGIGQNGSSVPAPASTQSVTPSEKFLNLPASNLPSQSLTLLVDQDLSPILIAQSKVLQDGDIIESSAAVSGLTSCMLVPGLASLDLSLGTSITFSGLTPNSNWSSPSPGLISGSTSIEMTSNSPALTLTCSRVSVNLKDTSLNRAILVKEIRAAFGSFATIVPNRKDN